MSITSSSGAGSSSKEGVPAEGCSGKVPPNSMAMLSSRLRVGSVGGSSRSEGAASSSGGASSTPISSMPISTSPTGSMPMSSMPTSSIPNASAGGSPAGSSGGAAGGRHLKRQSGFRVCGSGTLLIHGRQLLVNIRLCRIELDDLFVDGDSPDHESGFRQLIGNNPVLLDGLSLAPREHQGVGVAETDLGILGILAEERLEPNQSFLVIPLVETGLDLSEWIFF